MEKKSKLLTIGQFAALHGINKKTLMWYDEAGLFKPTCINSENGYRYYSYYQSSVLETILLLRELNVSIEEIRAFMENRSAAGMECLLREKIEDLDRDMEHLKAVRKTLSNQRQNMLTLMTMDLSEISVVEKCERSLVTVGINGDTSFDRQVEMITAQTRKYRLRRLHDASYGTMISVENLYAGQFEDYSALFIEIPFPIRKTGLHIQPGGQYLRAFYTGPWERMTRFYEKTLDYARKNHIELTGFSYESIINESVIDRVEDAIIQIEIPIKSRTA